MGFNLVMLRERPRAGLMVAAVLSAGLLPSAALGAGPLAAPLSAHKAASRTASSTSQPVASDQGAQLYQAKLCGTCHGAEGNQPIVPLYPKIGGQNAPYLQAQVKDIMSGKRSNGQSAVMKVTLSAIKLSDDELMAIAEWLAKKSG